MPSIISTLAMREIGFGISPPTSTPSAKVRAPPAPAKVSVRMPMDWPPRWLVPNMKTAKWLACHTAVASLRYFSLAASILPIVAQAALLTDWIAPTVATETGAGRVQFTIVPSGAIIVIGRMAPSFQTMSKQRSGNSGANKPPSEAHFEQLTLYFDCGEEPVKSK